MNPIGPALMGVGGVAVVVAHYAERYHSRRFQEHVEALEGTIERNDPEAMSYEVKQFHEDRRVDWAIEAMFWGHTVGILAVAVGLFLTLR